MLNFKTDLVENFKNLRPFDEIKNQNHIYCFMYHFNLIVF